MKRRARTKGILYRRIEVGSNTPEVGAVGMEYTDGACYGDKVGNMACFLRERRRGGNKGEERGSARRGRRAAVVSTKRRKEGKWKWGGVWYRERWCGVGSRPNARKGKVHSAQGRRALHDVAVTRKRDDNGPDIDGVHRARSEITRHA